MNFIMFLIGMYVYLGLCMSLMKCGDLMKV